MDGGEEIGFGAKICQCWNLGDFCGLERESSLASLDETPSVQFFLKFYADYNIRNTMIESHIAQIVGTAETNSRDSQKNQNRIGWRSQQRYLLQRTKSIAIKKNKSISMEIFLYTVFLTFFGKIII